MSHKFLTTEEMPHASLDDLNKDIEVGEQLLQRASEYEPNDYYEGRVHAENLEADHEHLQRLYDEVARRKAAQ